MIKQRVVHSIEPYYNWKNYYSAEEDPLSPFYEREYSELYFTDQIYNHYIHPQWDNIGSSTLFIKILFVDYASGHAIVELFGEWNDCLHNDIMFLKRDIVEVLMYEGINKFILIGENVLNFHYSDDCYYEEWFEEVEEGWIALLNFRDHVIQEFKEANIDSYFIMGGQLNQLNWRTQTPSDLCEIIEGQVMKRIG